MPPEFPHLQLIGNFGLTEGKGYSIIKHNLGDGYKRTLRVGHSAGTRFWGLKYSVLPNTLDNPVQQGTEPKSRAQYLFEFFEDRMREGDSPFTITNPRDGKLYLAGFVDPTLTFEMMWLQLYQVSGVALEQRRVEGVNELEDGSLGLIENPDVI